MATDEQVATLDAVASTLEMIEKTINGALAARDGMLAIASRLALSIAEESGGVEVSDLTLRAVAAELGAALRVSDRTVQRRMADAAAKVESFPLVWQAQGTGRISAGHARVIMDAGEHIEDAEARAEFSARVLEFAEEESPNRLRPIAERVAQQYQPRTLAERHVEARGKRDVWVQKRPDGMAELGILGPAVLVQGAYDRLTGMAKAPASSGAGASAAGAPAVGSSAGAAFGCTPAPCPPEGADRVEPGAALDDPRRLGQRRADLALDLLLTGAPAGHDTPDALLAAIVPHVNVTVPVLTLMGAGGAITLGGCTGAADTYGAWTPEAELDGRRPIDPGTARMLAGAVTGWDRVLTDPITGALLSVDRYRPSLPLRRHLRARDQRCRFPGCGMPTLDSDLDHTLDAALGGATEDTNLGTLCRRHHVLKHHSPWQVEQLGGGLFEWTSTTGRTYVDQPPPLNTVTFTASSSPPGTDRGSDTGDPGKSGDPGGFWATAPPGLLAPF